MLNKINMKLGKWCLWVYLSFSWSGFQLPEGSSVPAVPVGPQRFGASKYWVRTCEEMEEAAHAPERLDWILSTILQRMCSSKRQPVQGQWWHLLQTLYISIFMNSSLGEASTERNLREQQTSHQTRSCSLQRNGLWTVCQMVKVISFQFVELQRVCWSISLCRICLLLFPQLWSFDFPQRLRWCNRMEAEGWAQTEPPVLLGFI